MKKPDATSQITIENFRQKVWPLPAEDLLYVGPATKRKLADRNIRTIGQIARCSVRELSSMLGRRGELLWRYANGLDNDPVSSKGEEAMIKSVGNSVTAQRDLTCEQDARSVVTVLSESVAERLRANALCGNVVELSVRDCELNIFSRRRKIARPTALASEIIPCAMNLFHESYHWERPIRSMGVSVSSLRAIDGDEQMVMFPDTLRERRYDLECTVEDIRHRFGHASIQRASLFASGMTRIDPRGEHVIYPCCDVGNGG